MVKEDFANANKLIGMKFSDVLAYPKWLRAIAESIEENRTIVDCQGLRRHCAIRSEIHLDRVPALACACIVRIK